MEVVLHEASRILALFLDALSVLIVAIGAVIAVGIMIRQIPKGRPSGEERREAYLHFARFLVAALTFQLGADIVRTIIDSSWEEIGRVGAIAVIRTFLTYFLEKDMDSRRERARLAAGGGHDAGPG